MSQAERYLVIGETGAGKTVLATELVQSLRARGAAPLLVIASTDDATESPLAALCSTREEVDTTRATRSVDLYAFLLARAPAGVYLEVTAVDAARDAFMDRLGAAVLQLGATLLVVDEAHELLGRRAGPRLLSVWTRGRKRGVTAVAITQSIKQRPTTGVSPTVLNRSTTLVAFGFADPTGHEAAQVLDVMPEAAEYLPRLRTPHDGGPPEYLVRHSPSGRLEAVMRDGVKLLAPRATGNPEDTHATDGGATV